MLQVVTAFWHVPAGTLSAILNDLESLRSERLQCICMTLPCCRETLRSPMSSWSHWVQTLKRISSASRPLQCYRHSARGALKCDQMGTFSTIQPVNPLINTLFDSIQSNISERTYRKYISYSFRERERAYHAIKWREIHPNTSRYIFWRSHSPRAGSVQPTDLMLGVLAQFPESPDRCHSSSLGVKRRYRRLYNSPLPGLTEQRLWERKMRRGIIAPPPSRAVPASLIPAATPLLLR